MQEQKPEKTINSNTGELILHLTRERPILSIYAFREALESLSENPLPDLNEDQFVESRTKLQGFMVFLRQRCNLDGRYDVIDVIDAFLVLINRIIVEITEIKKKEDCINSNTKIINKNIILHISSFENNPEIIIISSLVAQLEQFKNYLTQIKSKYRQRNFTLSQVWVCLYKIHKDLKSILDQLSILDIK